MEFKTSKSIEELRAVICDSFPELAGAKFTLITAGWDSVAVDVDDRLIFKFPRESGAERALVTEASLLKVVRRSVTMRTPELTIYPGPPLFSRHEKLKGEHLLTEHYENLSEPARDQLAAEMALFYAQMHTIAAHEVEEAGATAISSWYEPEFMSRHALPLLSDESRSRAERIVDQWSRLSPDPHGQTYGFFDGHGWNMAFDHEKQRLNGIYDFADSGFGPLHQEFIYTNWISKDLTARIITRYEKLTGRDLDRERIDLLSGAIRLSELVQFASDAENVEFAMKNWIDWTKR